MLVFGLSAVINFSLLYCFGEGMSEVLSRACDIRESNHTGKSVHQWIKGVRSIKWFYLGCVVVIILGTLFPEYPWLWMGIFISLVAIILWKIYKTQSFLVRGQRGYDVLPLDAKTRTILCAAGTLVVLLPFVISLGFFILPRSTWFESPVSERPDLQRIENRIGKEKMEILLEDISHAEQMIDVLERFPEEEIQNFRGVTECVTGSQVLYSEINGIEISFIRCRTDNQTIYQVVSFSIPMDRKRGGWDSILLPDPASTLDPESSKSVYIFTEDQDGTIYSQRPLALSYVNRTSSVERKQTSDLVCIDYTVADEGCRQWVIICSTFPDDDGTGNPLVLKCYGEIFMGDVCDPLRGYVYIRREQWMPVSYPESIQRPHDQERGVYVGFYQEFGYARICTIEIDRESPSTGEDDR
jgi:hypothetical protein